MTTHDAHEILTKLINDKVYIVGKNLNCRCPVCGDSKKSTTKRRFWVLVENDRVNVYCHNCNHSQSFAHFVKDRDISVYNRYFRNKNIDKAISNLDVHAKIVDEKLEKKSAILDVSGDILPVSFLLLDRDVKSVSLKRLQHRALKLVLDRKIPREFYKDFLVCYENINGKDERNFENRLIIPFYDNNDIMYAFQGRSLFAGQDPKYKTWNKTNTKVYNYYSANPKELVLITEGPVDSMFLINGVSTTGTIKYGADKFHEISDKFLKRGWVFDYDKTGIEKSIEWAENGELVFCWPKEWRIGKEKIDCNSIFLRKKLTVEQLDVRIRENLYTGLGALARLKL
jgi:transcription elongation factor Elf1